MRKRLLQFFVLTFSLASLSSYAQLKLKVVMPLHGSSQMQLTWDTLGVNGIDYEYRKKENVGAYSAWTAVGKVTTFTDNGPFNVANEYTYQIRAKLSATAFSAPSNERKNSFKKIWPVQNSSCNAESIELLNGFGQPIKAGGSYYLHEGLDMHGESATGAECVKAPVGGIIMSAGGSGSNIAVNIQVSLGGNTRYIQLNHLKNLNAKLVVGESVAPGDSVGFINDGVAGWSALSSHTHCHFWSTYANLFGTTITPFAIWDDNAKKDPQGNAPQVLNTNGDAESVRFRKGPHTADYFADDGKVWGPVDIVAEAVDKQSSDAPWQVPKVIGYFVQMHDGSSWVDKVKTSAAPYILADNGNYFNSNSSSGNPTVMDALIDQTAALKSIAPHTPADYAWEQYFTYIVTNTKGTSGTAADLDKDQCWATDARTSVAQDNGYASGYAATRCVKESKFEDGKYRVGIHLKDHIQTAADHHKEIMVDNFRPFVEKVEIESGSLTYVASWSWNSGSGQLTFTKSPNDKGACGKVKVKVYTSETMKDVTLAASTLGGFTSTINTPVANSNGKQWEFEIPEANTQGADTSYHKLEIDGHDIADNPMQGFTSTSAIAGLPKHQLDGTWSPNTAPAKDNVHKFKFTDLSDKITLTKEDLKCHGKKEGKITASITGGTAPYTYAWAPDGGTGPTASNLGAGSYTVTVTDSKGCKGKKDTLLKEPAELKAHIAEGGFEISFCIGNGPPTVTLHGSGSGGTPPYTYNWPGGVLTVSSTGTYTLKVTDKNGCEAQASCLVVFVPIFCSRDPNDIVGPDGVGAEKWVAKKDELPYKIRFENDPKIATAPAQVVKINQVVDNTVNIYSMVLGDFGFANMVFQVPDNRNYYATRLDVKDSLGIVVDVIAGIDVNKNEIFWIFKSIDPATGLPPADALKGFLPVNDSITHKGEGFVSYRIRSKSNTVTGDSIRAQANIVFDINEAILTPKIFNTIDALPPTSEIDSIPSVLDSTYAIKVNAHDESGKGSGVATYDLYLSENGANFEVMAQQIPIDSVYPFKGENGKNYCVYSVARDSVGNLEAKKTSGYTCFSVSGKQFVKLTQPDGSTDFCVGDTIAIKWASADVDSVHIDLSVDGGNTFQEIASNVSASDTIYKWIIPDSLTTGTSYLVRITDVSDSTLKDISNGISINSPVNPAIISSLGNSFCNGDSTVLDAGTGYTTYAWSTGDSTRTITAAQSGVYYVDVTDVKGCKAKDTIQLIVNPKPSKPLISAGGPTEFCEGGDVILTSLTTFAEYNWSNGQNSRSINVSYSGTFTLSVKDSIGCESPASDPVTVVVNPLPAKPVVTVTGSTTFCAGGSVELSAALGHAGYKWSNGATTASILVNNSGSYSVVIIDAKSCESPSSDPVTVVVNPLPAKPIITANGPTAFCTGDSVVLSAPAGYAHYEWSNGDTLQSITVKSSGIFMVAVTDTNACSSVQSDAVNVDVNPLPEKPLITASGPTTFCKGSAVTLSAPSGFTTYLWSNGSTSSSIMVDSSGYFTVSVGINGCQSPVSDSVGVTVIPGIGKPVVTASGSTTFCSGNSILLSAPSGYLSYLWSNGDTLSSIVVSQSGKFTVVVKDTNSCISDPSDTTSVKVNPTPAKPVITIIGQTVFCNGDSVRLIAPDGLYEYRWSTGETTQLIKVTTSGSFSVKIKSADGCISPASDTIKTIVQPTVPKPLITASGPTNFCAGDSVVLSASSGYSSYLWSNGESGQSIVVKTSGAFSVAATASCGTAVSDTIAIHVDPTPVVITTKPASRCGAGKVTLGATASEGTLNWYAVPAGGISLGTGISFTSPNISSTTTYYVDATNNGCISTRKAVIATIIPATVKPDITASGPTTFCQGGNVVLTASSGYTSYSWTSGETTQSITVNSSGSYRVRGTDDCGTKLSDPQKVTVRSLPAKPVIKTNGPTTFCIGGNVVLSAPGGNFTYSWSNGETTRRITVTSTGMFTVRTINAYGCMSPVSDTVNVNAVPSTIIVDAGPNKTVYPGGNAGSSCVTLDATVTGSVNYKVKWSTGATGNSITVCPKTTTNYTITATDVNGCRSTDEVRVCAISTDCGTPNNPKVQICHTENNTSTTMCIPSNQLWIHLNHGDKVGTCGTQDSCLSDVVATKTNLSFEDELSGFVFETFPNPFSTSATIQFRLSLACKGKLQVFSMTGKEVVSLFEGQIDADQLYEMQFNPENATLSGIYICKLITDQGNVFVKKLVLVR